METISPMAIFQVATSIAILGLSAYYFIKALRADWYLIVGKKAKNGSRIYRSLESGKKIK
jgi:hypothetical protein